MVCAISVHPLASQARHDGPRLVFQPITYSPRTPGSSAGVKIQLALAPEPPAIVHQAHRRHSPLLRAPVVAASDDLPRAEPSETDLVADVSADHERAPPPDDGFAEDTVRPPDPDE